MLRRVLLIALIAACKPGGDIAEPNEDDILAQLRVDTISGTAPDGRVDATARLRVSGGQLDLVTSTRLLDAQTGAVVAELALSATSETQASITLSAQTIAAIAAHPTGLFTIELTTVAGTITRSVTILRGEAGSNGSNGGEGATGPQGQAGASGANGSNGAEGATGATGPVGGVGATGATGAQGPPGTNGGIGATGATGATGAPGSQEIGRAHV